MVALFGDEKEIAMNTLEILTLLLVVFTALCIAFHKKIIIKRNKHPYRPK